MIRKKEIELEKMAIDKCKEMIVLTQSVMKQEMSESEYVEATKKLLDDTYFLELLGQKIDEQQKKLKS